MCGILALLFIAVPAVELYILIQVGSQIGALATIGIIIVTGVVGAALAKHQGFAALRQVQRSLIEGDRIGRSMVEGALVLFAGALMLTPGFVTDTVGLLLLLPPVRKVVAAQVIARAASRVTTVGPSTFDVGGPERREQADEDEHEPPPPGVIDV